MYVDIQIYGRESCGFVVRHAAIENGCKKTGVLEGLSSIIYLSLYIYIYESMYMYI